MIRHNIVAVVLVLPAAIINVPAFGAVTYGPMDRHVSATANSTTETFASNSSGVFNEMAMSGLTSYALATQLSDIPTDPSTLPWLTYAVSELSMSGELPNSVQADSFFDVFFELDVPLDYALSGVLNAVIDRHGVGSSSFELFAGATKIHDFSVSADSSQGFLTDTEVLSGNGTLLPGEYRIVFNSTLSSSDAVDLPLNNGQPIFGGNVSSNFSFILRSPIPEPTSLSVWLILGLVNMVGRIGCRRAWNR